MPNLQYATKTTVDHRVVDYEFYGDRQQRVEIVMRLIETAHKDWQWLSYVDFERRGKGVLRLSFGSGREKGEK